MKFYLASFVILFTWLNPSLVSGRNKDLMKATYYYSHNKFHDAIPFYEKVASDEKDPEIYAQLGDCYRYTSKTQLAADWYAKAVALEGCDDQVRLHLAQLLMELTQYDSARKYLLDFQSRNKNDRRVANMLAGCASAPALLAASPKGSTSFLNINTNSSEYAPSFWKNMLVFTADANIDPERDRNKIQTFVSNRVYAVTCDREGVVLKTVKKITVKGLKDDQHLGPATFSQDGKKMYYTVTKNDGDNGGSNSSALDLKRLPLEIVMATDYDSSTGEFQTIKPFKYNSKDFSMQHPTVSPDGKILMFSSDMTGGSGGSDIYYSRKGADGEWSKPINAGRVINTEGDEVFPYLSDDNTLFFSSDGHEGLGGLDVFMSKWDARAGTFSKPVNVGTPINSSYDDISLALFADGRSSYFSSNRPALKGGDNLYFFNREHAYLRVKLFDEVTGNPLNVAIVYLECKGEKRYIAVDKFGEFVAPVYHDENYKLVVSKNGYNAKTMDIVPAAFKNDDTVDQVLNIRSVNTPADDANVTKVTETPLVKNEPVEHIRDSSYYKKPSLLIMTIIDAKTKRPIRNATVGFESEKDNREIIANEKGKLFTQLLPEVKYTISVMKDGYVTKELTLKTVFGREEPDTVIEKVALKVGKSVKKKIIPTEAGESAGPAIAGTNGRDAKGRWRASMDGYYAEYNKSEIVDSRKYVLDSMVLMMKEYPKMRICVIGHADCRGSVEYNQKLSTERAIAVGKYMIAQGIDPRRLQHKGVGSSKPVVACPVCSECNEAQHEKNRGFEYVILDKEDK